jgi:hypothetical protein
MPLETNQSQILEECCRNESTSDFSTWLLNDDDDHHDDDYDYENGDYTFNTKLILTC